MSRRRRRERAALEARIDVRRKKSLDKLLHTPLADLDELQELERKVAEARRGFVGHAASWAAVSAFLALVNALTQDPEPWFIFPMLGWSLALAPHAMRSLLTLPRDLAVQRQLLVQRGLLAPEAAQADAASLAAATSEGRVPEPATRPEELASLGAHIRARLRDLPRPRIDLEAALDVAERQASRIATALASLDGLAASTTAGHADADRRQALRLERERLSATLEAYRVTLANLEVDALLLSNTLETHGSALDSLRTESEMLHAAAEGAQKAMESLAAGRPYPTGRERA